MAVLFQKARQLDSAEYYARLSLDVARQNSLMADVLSASRFLAGFYKDRRNIDSAFVYMNQLLVVNDSLFSVEKVRQAQSLRFNENMRQMQLANEREAAAAERRTNIQYAIIGIGVVTFLLIFLQLSRTVIVTEKWIRFLGILGLLLVFEFINIWLHPFLGEESPLLVFPAELGAPDTFNSRGSTNN